MPQSRASRNKILAFIRLVIKSFKLNRLMRRYYRVLQTTNNKESLEDIDNDLFKLVMNDPYLSEVISDYNISENQLKTAYRFMISSGGGIFVRGGYLPASTISILPTLTYLCKKISQHPEILNKQKSRIVDVPANQEEWFNIFSDLYTHFESESLGPVKEHIYAPKNAYATQDKEFTTEEKDDVLKFDKKYNKMQKKWIKIATTFVEKNQIEEHLNKTSDINKGLFNYLGEIAEDYLQIVTNGHTYNRSEGIHYILGFNRIAKDYNVNNFEIVNKYRNYLETIFYLGMLTQLNAHAFPTRHLYKKVSLDEIRAEWFISAITADVEMKGYGANNPIVMGIFNQYYNNDVRTDIKTDFNVGSFGIGKFDSFFKNLFLAGAYLVMICELATKKHTK